MARNGAEAPTRRHVNSFSVDIRRQSCYGSLRRAMARYALQRMARYGVPWRVMVLQFRIFLFIVRVEFGNILFII